jgi:flagellar FliJ protein
MSTLDTLIRVNRWKLDERRRQLNELERLFERLGSEAVRLEEELTREQRIAGASLEAGYAYAGYARDLTARRQKLAASISEVEGQLIVAREALAESFGEVKRYEIAAANRQKRDRATVERRQRIVQDEVALQVYRRRNATQS